MAAFEYVYSGDLTPVLEEKTTLITQGITGGTVPFNLVKYYDEDVSGTDKKKRTFVLVSPVNITDYLYNNYFKDCNMVMNVYYKQRIV